MTTEGWIFMVGFRVFDVGLLVLWLVWFFRLRDDDDKGEDGGGNGGGGPHPVRPTGPGGGGLALPLGRFSPGAHRRGDHGASGGRPRRGRGGEPFVPGIVPRVRRPVLPVPVHRRGVTRA
ncbi:MAG: hypothetical protein IRZ21_09025 [Thermoleophilaceae bacterium]|nr:hypothetical protein [Thermoleophilaceae bacterium]